LEPLILSLDDVLVRGSSFPSAEAVIIGVHCSFHTSQGKIDGPELCKNVEAES
jgi:hypothetical protein